MSAKTQEPVRQAQTRLAGIRNSIDGLRAEYERKLRFLEPHRAAYESEAFLQVMADRRRDELLALIEVVLVSAAAWTVMVLPRAGKFGGRELHLLPVSDIVPIGITHADSRYSLSTAVSNDRHKVRVTRAQVQGMNRTPFFMAEYDLDGEPHVCGYIEVVPCKGMDQAKGWMFDNGGRRDRQFPFGERTARRYLPSRAD